MSPLLESERLSYQPLSLKHLHVNYVQWLNDIDVYRYLETGGDYTLAMLEGYLKKVEGNPEMLFWAIHLKENGKHIGNIKIDPVSKKHGLGEYGIMMGDKTEWGKGYSKEATLRIIDYCFKEINLRKIILGVVSENENAVQLYKKIGFDIEGTYKKHAFYNGHYCDVLRMAIFNSTFSK